jgi:hypothetical protein
MKTVLSVLNTNQNVPVPLLRGLVRPMFACGHVQQIRARNDWNVDQITITTDDEVMLSNFDCPEAELPAYCTESFRMFLDKIIDKSLLKHTTVEQIESLLQSVAEADATFRFSRATDKTDV